MGLKVEGAISVWDKQQCKYSVWMRDFADRHDVKIEPYKDTFVAIKNTQKIENDVVIDDIDIDVLKEQIKRLNNEYAGRAITNYHSLTSQINIVSAILIELANSTDTNHLSDDKKKELNDFILFVRDKEKILAKKQELDILIDKETDASKISQYLLQKQLESVIDISTIKPIKSIEEIK